MNEVRLAVGTPGRADQRGDLGRGVNVRGGATIPRPEITAGRNLGSRIERRTVLDERAKDFQPVSPPRSRSALGQPRPPHRQLDGQRSAMSATIGVAGRLEQLGPLSSQRKSQGASFRQVLTNQVYHPWCFRVGLSRPRERDAPQLVEVDPRVGGRGVEVSMTQQIRDGVQARAALEQPGGKGATQYMGAGRVASVKPRTCRKKISKVRTCRSTRGKPL
jgi:hypothetical protein